MVDNIAPGEGNGVVVSQGEEGAYSIIIVQYRRSDMWKAAGTLAAMGGQEVVLRGIHQGKIIVNIF